MRDMKKYAKSGANRLRKHEKYDLACSEVVELMKKASRSPEDLFYVIGDVFYMGVEAGNRMAKKKGRC